MVIKPKTKKKRWFQILASPIFNSKLIGETLAYEPKDIIGRTASVSMMNLTGDVKRQNINVTFEVFDVKDEKALTQIKKFEMTPSSVRRLVRKGKDKIDMSFVCETADKKYVRIKPIFFTIKSTGGTQLALLRKTVENSIAYAVGKMNYEDLIRDILQYKLQRDVKSKLNKIYPIKTFEIRVLELLKGVKIKPKKVEELVEPVREEIEEESLAEKVKKSVEKADAE